MKKSSTLLFLFLIFYAFSYAQDVINTSGAEFTAMGNATVAISDMWSIQKNQAGLSLVKKPSIGIAYENKFLIKDLSSRAAVFILPVSKNVFGISFNDFGFDLYKQQKIGIAYSRAFNEKISFGFKLNYLSIKIEEYGNSTAVSADLGLQYKLSEKFTLGAHIQNPSAEKFSKTTENLIPTAINAGFSYNPSQKVSANVEVQKDLDQNAILRAGLSYRPTKIIAIRGGVSGEPFNYYVGFGLLLKDLRIDLATTSHPILGYSPQMSLSYVFN